MSEASFPGGEFLRGRSPREILARLVDGDPLEIEARCRERIETLAFLVDPSRTHVRAVARVARAAVRWTGETPLAELLQERIDFSIRELVAEDREEERGGVPPSEPWDPRYTFVSEILGIEPALGRRACIAFNSLPERVRCTYYAIAVLGMSVNRRTAQGYGPPERVKAEVEMAVQTISSAIGRPPGGPGGIHGG